MPNFITEDGIERAILKLHMSGKIDVENLAIHSPASMQEEVTTNA